MKSGRKIIVITLFFTISMASLCIIPERFNGEPGFCNLLIQQSDARIVIDGNTDLAAQADRGNGSFSNPYIIENKMINCNNTGTGIAISNTDDCLVIQNCTILNTGSQAIPPDIGVFLNNVSNCTIQHCNFNNTPLMAIALLDCRNNSILNNNIEDAQDGITLYESTATSVEYNNVSRCSGQGLVIQLATQNQVAFNNFSCNAFGIILFGGSDGNNISNNICSYNTGNGISIEDAMSPLLNNAVNNNQVIYNSWSGIYVAGGLNTRMEDNEASFNGRDGIELAWCNNSIVSRNHLVANNRSGIWMWNTYLPDICHDTNISQNTITNNRLAGMNMFGINTTISGNEMVGCGLEVLNGSLNQVFSNHVDASNTVNGRPLRFLVNQTHINLDSIRDAGQLVLVNCNDSVISGMNVSYGTCGFTLIRSGNNTIWGNAALNNTKTGISIEATSNNNKIYLNTFAGNAWSEALAHDSSGNTWDNGSRGNYWGDYTTRYQLAGNDGITWNTAYQINSSSDYDQYPLVNHPSLNVKPVANFTADTTSIVAGQSVSFTFTGSQGNQPASYQWDFGDSSPKSTDQNPSHPYSTPGIYTVTLVVNDTDGDTSMKQVVDYITVVADLQPVASFSVNATSIIAGQSIQFNFTGTTGNGLGSLSWNFGDTQTSSSINTTHQFPTPGNYTITLTVIDSDGDSNGTTRIISVRTMQPPGSFTLTSTATTPDIDGSFSLTWTAASGTINYTIYMHSNPITTINGSLDVIDQGLVNQSFQVSLLANGTYYFVVVAFNGDGNTTSNCLQITVQLQSGLPPNQLDPIVKFLQDYGLYLVLGAAGVVVVVGVAASRRKAAKSRRMTKDLPKSPFFDK